MEPMTLSRRGLIGSVGALAGAAVLPRMAWASAAAQGRFPAVTSLIESYVKTGKLPGMIAALGQGSNAAPIHIARGTLAKISQTPVDMDSLFRIYSMTKPITGMAAMMLIDEGKLRLDQPIADLVPAFARMQVQVTPDGSITDLQPAKTQITIRHLLTHTSGLGYSIIQSGPIKDAYIKAGIVPGRYSRLPVPGVASFKPVTNLAQFTNVLATMPLVYEPGTTWSYSVGLDVMGHLIALVSGQPFEQFLQERLFAPAGMNSTWFRVPKSQIPRLTTNYAAASGLLLPLDSAKTSVYLDPPPAPFGGAGLVSSPRDYDRFLAMLLGMGKLGSRQVMSEAAVRMGTSNLLPERVDTAKTIVAGNGFGAGGAVGLGKDAGTYGWAGAAGTVGFVNLRAGIRAAIYAQFMPANAFPIQTDFSKAVLADYLNKKAAA